MSARKHKRPCGNPECAVSSGIHEGLTFGSGDLCCNGFWEKPCAICARDYERRHPEVEPCWPFADGEEQSPEAPEEAAR